DILRATSGFETVFRKVMHYGFERAYRIHLMGSAVRLSPTQCPQLYAMLSECRAILDIQEEVELFTMQDPHINAFTFGAERIGIVLHTSMIEHMSDDELFFVMCHELGHVKCGHVLYRFIAEILVRLIHMGGMMMGFGALFSQA